MNISIKFFEDKFIDAIGAGIYGIYIQANNSSEELLYVGESVFVLIRCATHLYEIKKGTGYLGFKKDTIENESITLSFRLLKTETDTKKRKAIEKEIIKHKHPKMQSGISDRVKVVENMIDEMTKLLNQ